MDNYTVLYELPSVAEYEQLRIDVGWDSVDASLSNQALVNSLYSVVIRDQQKLIGMGRG